MQKLKHLFFLILLSFISIPTFAQKYNNFKVSIYSRAYETRQMKDTTGYLKPIWEEITRQLKVDKIYLETHRDLIIVDQETLDIAKKFFEDRGIEVWGGITYTVSEPNRFQTFCYDDPQDRKKVKEIAEFTAKNFDHFILDDFFFTNCKTDGAIKNKGNRSWTEYRLQLMTDAASNLVLDPAKKVNPDVQVIIKYPNWYEHFQGLGFNLKDEPKMFDAIYTGTETRDAVMSAQHLQQYLGYNIFCYFSNIKPGGNIGGWVDTGGATSLDRYAEQLWLTLFAKAPEQTLFDLRQMQRPLLPSLRAAWQGQNTSFDFREMMEPVNLNGGKPQRPTTFARAAGYTLEKVDKFLGELGAPIGIKSYRPYNAVGEDFLQNYLGMIGLPMDMQPDFPAHDSVILLTEEAKFDNQIVDKIKRQLTEGKSVIITSGLLRALQDRGIDDIAELRYTDRKALVQDFTAGRYQLLHIDKPIMIPQIAYLTNDSWEMVSGIAGQNGWPILHEADYSKGRLYVMTIPDNFADLYRLPPEALGVIRKTLGSQMNVTIEGPGKVSLFVYDNNTCIVESFLNKETIVKVVTKKPYGTLTDLITNQGIPSIQREPQRSWALPKNNGSNAFTITLEPHSYRVFKFE